MKCYTCKRNKDREEFSSSMAKQCISCSIRERKVCPDCQRNLPLSEFKYKTGNRLYGYCKECRRLRNKSYDSHRRKTEDGALKLLLGSRKRDNSKASRDWREANPDYNVRSREYREKNRTRLLAGRQNQRAKLRGAPGTIRLSDWSFVLELFGAKCACSNDHEIDDNNPISIDHIKPFKAGGLNCVHNIQPLCRRCNMKKGVSEIDFRTEHIVGAIYEKYPECEVAVGRDCCRTEFEIRAGFFKGRPNWQEDS